MEKLNSIKLFVQPIIWSAALLSLYFLSPGNHVSLCIFSFAGLENCPGCGIGHAIHHALHFDFRQSVETHIMGIPATLALLSLIVRTFIHSIKSSQYGSKTAYDASGPSA